MQLLNTETPIYTRYRVERSNIRDEGFYLDRHELYGRVSMMPPDVLEINGTKIVAAYDLKFCPPEGKEFSIMDWQADVYRANFDVPCLYLFYWFFDANGNLMRAKDIDRPTSTCQYYPVALNHKAQISLKGRDRKLITEVDWVQWLHYIRGRKCTMQTYHLTNKIVPVTLPTIIGKLQ
jgi:hypothetical protein